MVNTRLGQGVDNSQEFLEENPEVAKEIEQKIRKEAGLDGPDEPSGNDEEPDEDQASD